MADTPAYDPRTATSPAQIMSLATAYWDSQALLTANRIGLFAAIGDETLGVAEIAARVAARERPTRLLLNACVALGLLESTPEGYTNSVQARTFLVPGGPGYLGNAIRYADNLYSTWGDLETALRTDRAPMATDTYTGNDQTITRDFVYAMHDRALGVGRVLVELVDLQDRHRMLDVGGGPGTYSALFTQRYPQLSSTVLDLPGVIAHARDIVASFGVSDRVTTQPGNYYDPVYPGDNDVVVISGVFHRESEDGCRDLIAKAKTALEPGGMLVVSDIFADKGCMSPAFATLFGLNMLLTAPDGGVHSDQDVARWMREAGFEAVRAQPFPEPMPHRVVTGQLQKR